MIHIISKEYYLKHRSRGKYKKIVIESSNFPIKNKFLMKDGVCFLYYMGLGFLVVPEDSGFTEDIIKEDICKDEWYLERYEKEHKLTKNYINAFPGIDIDETPRNNWIFRESGFLRLWNINTNESFIFYLHIQKEENFGITYSSTLKSYLCKLVMGDSVKFPIDIEKEKEFGYFVKDIVEWI